MSGKNIVPQKFPLAELPVETQLPCKDAIAWDSYCLSFRFSELWPQISPWDPSADRTEHFTRSSSAQKLFGITWGFWKRSSHSSGSLAAGTFCRLPAAFPGSAAKKIISLAFLALPNHSACFVNVHRGLKLLWDPAGDIISPSFTGNRWFLLILRRSPTDRE